MKHGGGGDDGQANPSSLAPGAARTAGAGFTEQEEVDQCDVCGQARLIIVDRQASVVQCTGCGYRFVSPRPTPAAIAAAYSDPHFYDGWVAADAGRLRMWGKRLAKVQAVTQGPKLLDIGAGIGTFLAIARDRAGWSVTGTEVSTAAINLARQHQINLLHGNAEDLEISPGKFDVVTLWHVLEHVPSPSRLLRVCHEALAPGGFLVLAVPNDSESRQLPDRVKRAVLALVGRRRPAALRYEPLRPGSEIHLSHFSLPVLKRLLGKEGFVIRRVSVDDHYPEPNWRTELIVGVYRGVLRLTGQNLGQAILVIAQQD